MTSTMTWRGGAVAFCLLAGCATLPKADQDLFAAVQADNPREVDQSLAAGARLDVHDDRYCDGLPPLGCAARWGSVKTVESLIARGADVNARGRNDIAPLNAAAHYQRLAVAELLIRHGADVNVRRKGGWTPLHNAFELLADSSAKETSPPADVATTLSLVKLLLASGAKVDVRSDEGLAPIHVAAATGQEVLVQALVDRGVDVNTASVDDATPLYFAAKRGAVEVAELLLAHGAIVNARKKNGFTPLHAGAERGNLDLSRFLVEHGADVNAKDGDGYTPILWACNGLLERYTLESPTPSSEVERHKMSTSQIAHERELFRTTKAEFNQVAVLLLQHGALPNVGVAEHKPMRTAALVGDKTLVEALLAHGGAVNPDSEGGLDSPLHAAIAELHGDVAALLVEKGADLNARTKRGRTPLHFAAFYMHDRRLIELLLEHGADVNARDNENHSPIAFATKAGNHDLADLLRQHGARD